MLGLMNASKYNILSNDGNMTLESEDIFVLTTSKGCLEFNTWFLRIGLELGRG